jgi:hypothetical protein
LKKEEDEESHVWRWSVTKKVRERERKEIGGRRMTQRHEMLGGTKIFSCFQNSQAMNALLFF